MTKDLKVVESKMSREDFEKLDSQQHDRNVKLFEEFLNLNQIPPDQAMTLCANALLWICEEYFNREVFFTMIEATKRGWDKNRG